MQNNGYGSQNTVVIADGRPPPPPLSAPATMPMQGSVPEEVLRQQQQQQEQMRLREEEITRRQAEQRRRQQEAEGIARRQHEAEEAARIAARQPLPPPSQPMQPQVLHPPQQQQNLATPSSNASFSSASASSTPMFANYPNPSASSSAVTTPSSTAYFQPAPQPVAPVPIPHGRIEYPSISQPSTAPLPLESPGYEGESTDSESIHHFKIGKPKPVEHAHSHAHTHRTPVRNVRSPAYPPPITTTSPPPTIGYPALPLLMSQHQKTQGYFPSLNSMFSDTGDRHAHAGTSALFGESEARNGSQSASLAPTGYPYTNGHGPRLLPPQPTSAIVPPPKPASSIPQIASAETLSALPRPPNAVFDPSIPLKTVSLPRECLPRFLAIAKPNTEMNKETCGLLLGKTLGCIRGSTDIE
ncbi:hypothetical protein CVT26_013090 [Gymnopilus dilepis]|uniref:Uncharacterized protein n=1 Tax=Gymnopilus dilepis TaxID=231916 RepID=A0A409WVL5_9AGAR|nr:hypothetical protein CVT26_013090 [Gymnopilus dilepis]